MIDATKQCIDLMKKHYGQDISMYETSFLEKALLTRSLALGSETLGHYLRELETTPLEASEIMEQLSNSYSEFFRNPLTFSYLEQVILPLLIGKKLKGKEKEIRIWSAACASGQEAYSIAILFDEIVRNANNQVACHLFATDINANELDNARKGVYHSGAVNNVTMKRINTYFSQQGDRFIVSPGLRKYIDFSVFDLLAGQFNCPPASVYGDFDLVFCSNLLFYYQPEYRIRIIQKVGKCLAQGGYLVTGETEREIVMEQNYRELFPNSCIFQKR